jgi:hypothetical protein
MNMIPQSPHNEVGGPKKRSLLDGLITGLFGPSTSEMTQTEGAAVEKQRAADQTAVSQDAAAMANDPSGAAKSFMKAPTLKGNGKDLLEMIGSVAKFFGA